MKKKAFTLTELLVVVVIIGVLAAVVLPKFTSLPKYWKHAALQRRKKLCVPCVASRKRAVR